MKRMNMNGDTEGNVQDAEKCITSNNEENYENKGMILNEDISSVSKETYVEECGDGTYENSNHNINQDECVKDSCADHAEYHATCDPPTDEYHYLKTGEYTSEVFKVIVNNLPSRVSYGCFRASMKSILGFKPKKVVYNGRDSYAFLAFSNDEEREKAISVLNERVWKKCKLECKKAAPCKDPYVRERKRKQKFIDEKSKRQKLLNGVDEEDSVPPEEKILHVVCPYASKPYEEQLSLKQEEIRSCMERLTKNMRANKIGLDWMKGREDRLCMDLLPIVRSPVLDNYRNKVEFTVGIGPDEKDNTVGFRLGSYREGSLVIIEPTRCINCNLDAIHIGKEFQEFIRSLPHPSYNTSTHTGFWQQLSVRTCTTGDLMLIVQVQPSHLSQTDLEDVQKKLVDHLMSAERSVKVTSIYMSSASQRNNTIDTFKFLAGEKYINEKLLSLQFRISPDAFFQVNTPAAEILYKTIHDWCDTNHDDACVLDVCCGTGTIGLCIASGTSFQVSGIEISHQAVEDARYNAEFNGIQNANFIRGPAEDVIYAAVRTIKSENVIAIVDPPRAGLRRNVIETLRGCPSIKKIIYVSCSPKQAADNFLSFCRPESKRLRGIPFRTTRAVPVDLFPHTPHCELIVELVRVNYTNDADSNECEIQTENKDSITMSSSPTENIVDNATE